jgi:methylated-DNA-[protein]-cysteine S-methyltransferase
MVECVTRYETPIEEVGVLYIELGADGVRGVRLGGGSVPGTALLQSCEPEHSYGVKKELCEWLDRYFANSKGTQTFFPASKLDMRGTEFELSVWREVLKIPFGSVCTYAQIARKVGSVGAARAVGTACGKNRLPILVPCHRVVASNGALGGYSAGMGTGTKMALLQHEGGYEGVGTFC